MIFNIVKDIVDKGKQGMNSGLPHGFKRLTEYIPDIQKSTYYVLSGESGSGKSALAYNSFMLEPLDYYINNKETLDIKVDVLLYSMEITRDRLLTKAVCRDIFKRTNVLLDVNYVISRGNKHRISDEHYKLVMESIARLEPLSDNIHILADSPTNPTAIWKGIIDFAKNNGSGIGTENNGNTIIDYKPHHNNHYIIVIIDHIALGLKERGFNTKEIIDKISEYLVLLRNKLGITPVVLQQLNRSMSSTDRFKLNRVEPQLSDLKDSSNTIQDCDIALSIFSPNRYDIENYRNYNISKLGDRFRSVNILKNRDGEADKHLGMLFVGECGLFSELPRADMMISTNTYDRVAQIKKSYIE